MHIALQALLEFHKKMGLTIGDPRCPNIQQEQEFRLELIEEELDELYEALDENNTVKAADALGDLIYVIAGAAVTWGIDIASIFDEVHRSNMTKSPEGKRADGKVMKPPGYSPPDIQGVLDEVAENFDCGPDGWWEEPTVNASRGEPTLENFGFSPEEISVLKEIKEDFLPGVHSNGQTIEGVPYTIDDTAVEKVFTEVASEVQANARAFADAVMRQQGQFTAYGAFVFDCSCGRCQAIQTRLGTRGGKVEKGQGHCMCGKSYTVDFTVTPPTIEEMSKANA